MSKKDGGKSSLIELRLKRQKKKASMTAAQPASKKRSHEARV